METQVLFEGYFSWKAAIVMVASVVGAAVMMALTIVSFQNGLSTIVGTDTSWISGSIVSTDLGLQPTACFGILTSAYFTSFIAIQDQGFRQVVDINILMRKGLRVFRSTIWPSFLVFEVAVVIISAIVSGSFISAVWAALGGLLVFFCCSLAMNICVKSVAPVTHVLSHDIFDATRLTMRAGALAGIFGESVAGFVVVLLFLASKAVTPLLYYAAGVSIVAYAYRLAGGVFAKSADIASDLLGEWADTGRDDDMKMYEIQQQIRTVEQRRKEKEKHGALTEEDEEEFAEHLKILETAMDDVTSALPPIDYLDILAENVCDIIGAAVDSFESTTIATVVALYVGITLTSDPSTATSMTLGVTGIGALGNILGCYYIYVHERISALGMRVAMFANSGLGLLMTFIGVTLMGVYYLVTTGTVTAALLTSSTYSSAVIIMLLGLLGPFVCIAVSEVFTSISFAAVQGIAEHADFGLHYVTLNGLGLGFLSSVLPVVVSGFINALAWSLLGAYGVALVCVSAACSCGFTASAAAFGAVANNAQRLVSMTTYHALTRNRANLLASTGTASSHAAKIHSAFVCFSLTIGVLVCIAPRITNYTTVASVISYSTLSGAVGGVCAISFFVSTSILACIHSARELATICKTRGDKETGDFSASTQLTFPASHMSGLSRLCVIVSAVACVRTSVLCIVGIALPLAIGLGLGITSLSGMLITLAAMGAALSFFLTNSGAIWDAAGKCIMFGLIQFPDGRYITPDSDHYHNLQIAVQIGGPLEDSAGPTLSNMIKFVSIFTLATANWYSTTPTWWAGLLVAIGSWPAYVLAVKVYRTLMSAVQRIRIRTDFFNRFQDHGGSLTEAAAGAQVEGIMLGVADSDEANAVEGINERGRLGQADGRKLGSSPVRTSADRDVSGAESPKLTGQKSKADLASPKSAVSPSNRSIGRTSRPQAP